MAYQHGAGRKTNVRYTNILFIYRQ
jgi:hypothetical protein